MTPAGVALGLRLRRAREQRGVSLRDVSATTKIAYPLLDALERGDISQWPGGIYRAGFIRAYATAIGLPPDETAAEFARAFGAATPEPEPARAEAAAAPPLRLTLAATRRQALASRSAAIAALDLCLVVVVGSLVSWPFGVSAWAAIACCALAYHAGSSAWRGRTPVAMWFDRMAVEHAAAAAPLAEQQAAPAGRPMMTLVTDVERERERPRPQERRSGVDRRRRPARPNAPHQGVDGPRLAAFRPSSVH